MKRVDIPSDIEDFRDAHWRREGTRQVQTPIDAEHFVEKVGFASCLSDSRRPGPSLYVAVCGRRDAVMPRNVQKDEEASLTWTIKDALINRGKVYYAKRPGGRAMFIAPRLLPHFRAVWGLSRAEETAHLSRPAQALLRVLRREWEMATADLKQASKVTDRAAFTRALDELQAAMLVIPSAVYYEPKFTYVYELAIGRFGEALRPRIGRDKALREIARSFLSTAGLTVPGELGRVAGIPRVEAGRGNHALVAEGFATRVAYGTYRLAALPAVVEASPGEPE